MADLSDQRKQKVAVLMVPLPAQGHINQFLQFSHLIAAYKIAVHYVGSATHNRQAKVRAYGLDQPNLALGIHFHDIDFALPTNPKHNTTPNKFPVHLQRVIEETNTLRRPVAQLMRALAAKYRRLVVIQDSLMASVVQDVMMIPNAETYTFHTSSAFAVFFTIWESMVEQPFQLGSDVPRDVPSYKGCSSPEFEKFLANQYNLLNLSSGRLYNTCTTLEGTYIDLLRKLPASENKKFYAIGPMHASNRCRINSKIRHRCLNWLDEQGSESVIYVSFGTTTSFTEEQIRELATGLEKSKQKFLWVLRDADKADIFQEDGTRRSGRHDPLPEGFEERLLTRGLVVRDWAPQLEILRHPATAGFISHCGWNSCLESVSMGVPIATWPIHSDQPKNSLLITEGLKVGIVVKDWAHHDKLVTSKAVENAVRRLMVSTEGQSIRKRAKELGAAVRGSTTKGGSSSLELDSFVAHITRYGEHFMDK